MNNYLDRIILEERSAEETELEVKFSNFDYR
jgi:hypothetical protein